ncbi:MAG TPA: 50S ribosomal protein L4 [Verrucomicrobiae bacterium]|nr:50S ribosomal protein L4 [Verrucomicrobiae bacterium]
MKLPVIDISGQPRGEVEFADKLLIKSGKGSQAVHDAVTAYMANQRLGSASTKQISEVTGSGKKPWRQKGTGRARAGSFASPLWRGGGVVFGPKPRDYSIRVPKKVKALAFRKALSERLLSGDLVVIDELKLASHKTKEFAGILAKIGTKTGATLLVTDRVDANLKLAARNLPGVQVEPADSVNAYELLRFDKIVATKSALEKLRARLGDDR